MLSFEKRDAQDVWFRIWISNRKFLSFITVRYVRLTNIREKYPKNEEKIKFPIKYSYTLLST